MTNYCIMCNRKLTKSSTKIGFNQEKGEYTMVAKEATQGWFDVGIDCFKTWQRKHKMIK